MPVHMRLAMAMDVDTDKDMDADINMDMAVLVATSDDIHVVERVHENPTLLGIGISFGLGQRPRCSVRDRRRVRVRATVKGYSRLGLRNCAVNRRRSVVFVWFEPWMVLELGCGYARPRRYRPRRRLEAPSPVL